MFNKHLIVDKNGIKYLYLYVDFNYELAEELNSNDKESKTKTIREKIIAYIKEKNINIKPVKVFLVVGGLVIGSLFIQNYNYDDVTHRLEPSYKYVEEIDIFNNKDILETPAVKNPSIDKAPEEKSSFVENNTISNENKISSTKEQTTDTKIVEEHTAPVETQTKTHTDDSVLEPTVPSPPAIEEPSPNYPSEPMVTIYRSIGTIETMPLESYVIGVVGAEMPASFKSEALKAQSVIARTYALKKMEQNEMLKDDVSHQVYKDNSQLKKLWGASFDNYYNKIKKAVTDTKGQTLTYNGKYIEAVYHSTSNGKTEDALAVWGNNYAYLRPVDSHWDIDASSYLRETEKDFNLLSSIIGINFNSETQINILSKTAGNRIEKIQIDNKIFSGIELRSLLGLRSADFDIKRENEKIVFVTRGYGHGVGMSQYGANGMANEGYNYKQILAHYYPNTNLKN